ncbi:MAG: cytochrome c3 family protein [Desulfuromonadales bacterium]|nr:cytochrome c3 family protein [Desulfuromonadales bacterium]
MEPFRKKTRVLGASPRSWYLLLLLLFPVFGLLSDAVPALGMDRYELMQILQTIPPNGPFETYGNTILRPPPKRGSMDPVIFPHWSHRARYDCRVCHLELKFSIYKGETRITRKRNLAGRYCGACHDGKTAFTVRDNSLCTRCHHRNKDAYSEAFSAFAEGMPRAQFGNGLDWAKMVKERYIDPVHTVKPGVEPAMHLPEKLRKPLELGTKAPRSGVLFSHEDHMGWLDCSNCHPEIFDIEQEGTQYFTMESNIFGQFCGVCHMRTGFPMSDCNRCHPEMKNHKMPRSSLSF